MRTATGTQEVDRFAATERRNLHAPSRRLYSDCAQNVQSSHEQVAEALRTFRRGSPTRAAVPSLRSTLTLPLRRRVRRRQPCRRLHRLASIDGCRLLWTQTRPASSRWECQLWVRRRAGPEPRQLASVNRSHSTLGTGTRNAVASVTREPSSLLSLFVKDRLRCAFERREVAVARSRSSVQFRGERERSSRLDPTTTTRRLSSVRQRPFPTARGASETPASR